MNDDQLHQLLKSLFKDYTWEWIFGFLKDIHGQVKGLDLIDKQLSIIPGLSNVHQFGDKLTPVKQWTGAKYKDMVKVWLGALAPLLKKYPSHFEIFKSVTNVILILSYHSHTETVLKYLQNKLSGIGSNMDLFQQYRESHSIITVPNIHSLLHYIKCIRVIDSADNSDNKVSKATHKGLIQDGYHSFNIFNYFLLML